MIAKKILRRMFEKLIPFTDLYQISMGNCYCPFHDNRKTKAAKAYHDSDCIRINCFGECGRQYTSYDYFLLIMGGNPEEYLKEKFTKEELIEVYKNCKDESLEIEDNFEFIDNAWVDSYENVPKFLDLLYVNYKL